MIRIARNDGCCGCHACAVACPSGSIEMTADGEGFLYPKVDAGTCTDCGICETVCPMVRAASDGEPPRAFAAWNRDDAVRAESSSGGVFNALMLQTLQQDGVVFGAAFDETMTLRHQSAQNEADAYKFRGSKYLQSAVGTTYHEARGYLQQGRPVLFSGTPCQVGGLYAYLGRNDVNLLTCDVVCHGVPSPKVFANYRESLERRHGARARRIAFRGKHCGWKRYSVSLWFENDTEYRRVLTEDPFMLGFLRDIYLRPSCHACRFSRLPRAADISLGDFWGVSDHHPEWDDDKGTSLVLVQTEKGQKALDACSDDLIIHEAELELAIRANPCICGSVPPGRLRSAFFDAFNRQPFHKVMEKYMSPPSVWHRLLLAPRRLARKGLECFRTLCPQKTDGRVEPKELS